MRVLPFVAASLVSLLVTACADAQFHRQQVEGDDRSTISVGNVQREIKVGMNSTQVAEALGSPNMVTTNDDRSETWVYDKVSTETVTSSGSIGGGGGAGGIMGETLLLGSLSGNAQAGATATSQKTLTIIIKFDTNSRVRDFSYRQSKF